MTLADTSRDAALPSGDPDPGKPPNDAPPADPTTTAGGVDDERAAGRAEDRALAQAARLGDRRAFETIVERHGPALTRYARRAVPDPGEAEDLVQEALVAAWQSLDRFDGRSALRTWLFGILTHKIASARRRRRAIPVEDERLDRPVATGTGDPVQHASDSELRAALEAALRDLPEGQRSVWVLIEVEGLSQAEAASVLRMTPDAVRGQLFRARRGLVERMRQWRA